MMTFFVEAINAGLNTFLFYLFFKTFWQKQSGVLIRTVSCVSSFSLLFATMLQLKDSPLPSLMVFVSSVILCFSFKSKFVHKIVYTLIITMLSFCTEMITGIGFVALLSLPLQEVKSGSFYVLGMMTSKLVLFIAIFIIRIFKHKPLPINRNKKQWGLIAFPVSSTVILVIQHTLLMSYPTDNYMHYLILFSDFALLVSNMIIFDYIDSLYENTVIESRIAHADKLIEMQAAQYRSLIESNYKLSKTKHDFKNFCIGIISELDKGETEAALEKLTAMYEDIATMQTGARNVLDTIIHIKNEQARKKGVSITYKGCNLPKLRFNDVDLSVLLGNAIDNAVEAAEKVDGSREVSVFITFKNDIVVVKIKNPVAKAVNVNSLNTTKNDINNHGFGIISMRQIVNKYTGELIFTCEKLQFVTTIIMSNLPSELSSGASQRQTH